MGVLMRPKSACSALVSAALALLAASGVAARPFRPSSDALVLETLPSARSALARQLASERRALAAEPRDFARNAALAWRYVDASRREGDPRYVGLAEGLIAPWLVAREPRAEALLLRATLRQNRHDFAGAEADLAAALARSPRDAQAWLTRAVVAKVRGDFALAQRSCLRLLGLADRLTATTCLADVAGLTGRARDAERALTSALAATSDAATPQRHWALVARAEIRERRGRVRGAEADYRAALAIAHDAYTVAALADLMLDARREREVLTLLGDDRRADGLLLRRALAERRLRAPGLAASVRELRARFAAAQLRGERLHPGEESRFALALGDARGALALARTNFETQREPRDLRVLLEAALAARDAGAARDALAFLERTQLEDARLAPLAARARELVR
jgi:tetratricopeptide (TPR) repeat protein